jgi:hypothetical protein
MNEPIFERDGDDYFLVVDDERILRYSNKQWTTAGPGFVFQPITLQNPDGTAKSAYALFDNGRELDFVIYLDPDGEPHAIPVTNAPLKTSLN